MANKVRSYGPVSTCTRRRSWRAWSRAESGEMTVHRLPGDTAKVVAFCAGLPDPTRVAYEAGPTGFGLARALLSAGVECVIAAPGKMERPAQDRVKTDQQTAERLVRLLMIDALHAVRVPGSGRGGAVRHRPSPGGSTRRFDARPATGWESCCCATTCAMRAPLDRWTDRHRAWSSRVELGARGARRR